MAQAHTDCTVETCDRPTQNYLCNTCVEEIQHHIDQIPDLMPVLDLIARGEERAFTQDGAINRGSTGSRAPLHINAFSDLQDLKKLDGKAAQPYALDPEGAWHKRHIESLVIRVERMVHGDDENKPTLDYINYRLDQLHPLPVPLLSKWFAEKLGIRISESRLYKWKERGIITPTTETGHPTYRLAAVYRAYERMTRK